MSGNLAFHSGSSLSLTQWTQPPPPPLIPDTIVFNGSGSVTISSDGFLYGNLKNNVIVHKNPNFTSYPVYSGKSVYPANQSLWVDFNIILFKNTSVENTWRMILVDSSGGGTTNAEWSSVIAGFIASGVSYIPTARSLVSSYRTALEARRLGDIHGPYAYHSWQRYTSSSHFFPNASNLSVVEYFGAAGSWEEPDEDDYEGEAEVIDEENPFGDLPAGLDDSPNVDDDELVETPPVDPSA